MPYSQKHKANTDLWALNGQVHIGSNFFLEGLKSYMARETPPNLYLEYLMSVDSAGVRRFLPKRVAEDMEEAEQKLLALASPEIAQASFTMYIRRS